VCVRRELPFVHFIALTVEPPIDESLHNILYREPLTTAHTMSPHRPTDLLTPPTVLPHTQQPTNIRRTTQTQASTNQTSSRLRLATAHAMSPHTNINGAVDADGAATQNESRWGRGSGYLPARSSSTAPTGVQEWKRATVTRAITYVGSVIMKWQYR